MAQVIERWNLMNGQIHFRPRVSREEVVELAKEFKDEHGDNIKVLAVRSCGSRRFGIAFAASYNGGRSKYDAVVEALTDKLRRRFGNDVNWDITSNCWEIK